MFRAATVFVVAAVLAVLVPAAAAEAAASWTVTPEKYDFAPRLIGTGPSAPAVFTLTNTGSTTLRPPGFTFGVPLAENVPPDHFYLTNHCETALAPGGSCAIEITFEANGIGSYFNSFGLYEAEGQVPSLNIRVNGSAAAPAIKFSPPALFLPSRLLGTELNPPAVLTVSNVGAADLHLSGMTLTNLGTAPVNPNQVKLVGGSCAVGTTLAVGASCTVQVTYTPTLAGLTDAGELQFTDNVPGKDNEPETQQAVLVRTNGVASAETPIPQDTYISAKPPKVLRRTWARFRFDVPETRATFDCKLDAAPFRPCSSPKTYRYLALGRHVFRVRPAVTGPKVSARVAVARFRVAPPLPRRHAAH